MQEPLLDSMFLVSPTNLLLLLLLDNRMINHFVDEFNRKYKKDITIN